MPNQTCGIVVPSFNVACVIGITGPGTSHTEALGLGKPRSRLHARVSMTEALGSEVLVHLTIAAPQAVTNDVRELAEDVGDDRAVGQLAAGLRLGEASVVGRFSPRTKVRDGEAVEVVVDRRALHFFDPETGLAIRGI